MTRVSQQFALFLSAANSISVGTLLLLMLLHAIAVGVLCSHTPPIVQRCNYHALEQQRPRVEDCVGFSFQLCLVGLASRCCCEMRCTGVRL